MDSRYITKEECIAEVERLYSLYGKVTKPIFAEHGQISYDTVKRRCGSLPKALKELGIELGQGQRKSVSKEEIIPDLIRVHDEFGYISKPLYEKHGKYNAKVVSRLFGSFGEMYAELGLKRSPNGIVSTDAELLENLERLNTEHGIVTTDIIRNFGKYSLTAYMERFGSINEAYEKAGLTQRAPGECSHANWVIRRIGATLNEEPIHEHRFDWLRNPRTNRILPVDGYFPEAGVVVEYNGPQHYHVMPRYTPTEEALAYRQELDNLKYDLIRNQGLKLIVIDYRDSFTESYIKERLGA